MRQAALTGRDLAAALAVVVVWGVNFVVMKLALRDFTPFQLGAARYVFAVLPLALFIRPPDIPWRWLAFYGLFQGVGQFGILFVALKVGMTAALASVLLQTQVFFTALFGFVLLRERASRPLQAGMVLAALGLACFALNYLSPATGGAVAATTLAGFVLTLGAAANRVAPFSLGVPVVGLTTGMLVLGEAITPWQWAGITLVVAALGCVMLGGLIKPR